MDLHKTVKQSMAPTMGDQLQHLGLLYQKLLNSHSKPERLGLLKDFSLVCRDMSDKTKRMLELMLQASIQAEPIQSKSLTDRVKASSGQDFHMMYLNLTQLIKYFSNFEEPKEDGTGKTQEQILQEKIQYLFQIMAMLKDLSEIALVTDAEPEHNLLERM